VAARLQNRVERAAGGAGVLHGVPSSGATVAWKALKNITFLKEHNELNLHATASVASSLRTDSAGFTVARS
jgi:hypothetical protein